MNTIFQCPHIFFGRERDHQLSTYATVGGMGSHPKCVQLRTGGGGVTPYVYVRTYTVSFHVLAALLSYSVLFYLYKFDLTFIQERRVRQKRLFFSNEVSFCRHEISFFHVKLFL